MSKHNQLEINVMHSFKNAKRDITAIQQQLIELAQRQEEVLQLIKTKPSNSTNTRIITKTIKQKHRAKTYIASKTGKKFHITECPFAKNIKPKSAVKFKTKDSALNKGYKPCHCIN